MPGEQQPLTEQELRNQAIDTLAVYLVDSTRHNEVQAPVAGFVSNITGILFEEVEKRLDTITDDPTNQNALLHYVDVGPKFSVNKQNPRASELLRSIWATSEVRIGDKMLAVEGLSRLVTDYKRSQRELENQYKKQQAFGYGIGFDPAAPIQQRPFIEKSSEVDSNRAGEAVILHFSK